MLDISKFLRIRNDKLEVFVAGFSKEFSLYARKENSEKIQDKRKYRVAWICDNIKESLRYSSVNLIVLDCRMENFFTNYIARDIIQVLDLKPNQVLVLTSTDPKDVLEGYEYIIDKLADIDFAFFYTKLMERQIDWENIEIDIPIMCLATRPTVPRARLIKDIAELCKDKARLSFGNVLNFPIADKERETYSSILDPYTFPFSQNTDNKVLDHPCDMQNDVGENMFKSLVSIVNETNDFDNDAIQLSEKSFKHFAWHQIPIFNASKGHVKVIRSLGFDMFDDIIDHSYDTAPNIHIQKLKIVSVVAKFLKQYPTVNAVNNLRKSIFHRLQANNQLLYKIYKERPYEPWPYYG